jgi:hypothetical protein
MTLTGRWVRRSRSQAATSREGAHPVVALAGHVPPKRQAPADSPNEVARTRGRHRGRSWRSGREAGTVGRYLADTLERTDARTPCGAAPMQYNAVRRSERAAPSFGRLESEAADQVREISWAPQWALARRGPEGVYFPAP